MMLIKRDKPRNAVVTMKINEKDAIVFLFLTGINVTAPTTTNAVVKNP